MVYKCFGEKLRELRLEKLLTQQKIADELNYSVSAWNQYEKGQRVPDNDKLKRIAEYFSVSSDYLLGLTENRYDTKDELLNCLITLYSESTIIDKKQFLLDFKNLIRRS